MTTIITRAGKGSALTYQEADDNFTNLKTDVESLQANITAANAAIVTANTAMKSYVDAQDSAITTAWTANAATQASQITAANAAIVTANTLMKSYVDAVTTAWTANAGVQADQISAANATIITANTSMKSYVDDQITTTQSWVTGANAAIVTANTALKGYVDDQITTTQSWVTGANAAIVTANTALKGYVDNQFTNLTNGAPAILDTLGEIAASLGNNASLSTTLLNSIAGANAAIVTANTAMKSYVDDQITTTQSWVTGANAAIVTANTALKSYVDLQDTAITTAWTANAGVQANLISAANLRINDITANLGSFQTYANATYIYSNANVASYLPVYSGDIQLLSITGVTGENIAIAPEGTGDILLQADTIQIGDNNQPVTIATRGTGNLILKTHHANGTQGNITLVEGANGNIKLWPQGTGVVESEKSIVVQGNVTANYILGDGSHLTGIPTSYGNLQVADYLPTYTGSLAASTDIIALYSNAGVQSDSITAANAAIVTANTALKNYLDAQITTVTSEWTANASQQQALIDIKANTASLATVATTGSYQDLVNTPTLYSNTNVTAYLSGTITVGNITSTGGFFWANGLSYSTPSTFSGDLVNNSLTASGTGRIFANASPQSNVTQIGSYTQGVVVNNTPVYTSGNLTMNNQTIAMVNAANVQFLTSWAAGTRTTNLQTAYLGVTAVSANTSMNANDRFRAVGGAIDMNLNGKNWGTLTSTSGTQFPILINGQTINIYGTGTVGQAGGISNAVTLVPVNGSISAQYATGYNSTVSYSTAGGGATASNIQYARLYTGFVTGVTGNLTVNNAIALHTISGWVSSNVSLITNAYTVLNEDSRSVIQTAGNIQINNTSTTGLMRFGVFTVTQLTAITGSAGHMAAVSNGTGKSNGAMAYWDVTNTRWSWVADDTAVT